MLVKCTGCDNTILARVIDGKQTLYPMSHDIIYTGNPASPRKCLGSYAEGVEVQQSPILPRSIIEISITSIFISNENNVDFVSFVKELTDFVQDRQREARDAALDWAAEHATVYGWKDNPHGYNGPILKDTILAGKTSKDLEI